MSAILVLALLAGAQPSTSTRERSREAWVIEIPPREVEPGAIRWVGSLDAALQEARLRAAPVVVVMGQDTSETLEYMLATAFLTPTFARAMEECVCLLAMKGLDHDASEVDGRRICKLFGVSCAEHDRTYSRLHAKLVHRSFWNPLVFVLDPEGEEILRLEGTGRDVTQILEEIEYGGKQVAEAHGRALSERAYRKLLEPVVRCRELASAGRGRDALAQLDGYGTTRLTSAFRELLVAERQRVVDDGLSRLLAAAALAGSDPREALGRLRKIARDYAGTEVEARAQAKIVELGG
jgi:hypothetical protein